MTIVKFLVQLVAAILAAIVPALAVAGPLSPTAWFNVIALAAGAVMVYNASNGIPGWGYAKAIASGVSAVAVLLMSSWAGGLDPAEIIQLILAFLGAAGVIAIPNGTPATQPAAG